jgi:hypothetical protein
LPRLGVKPHKVNDTTSCEHAFVTSSQGSLRHQFQRALERGSVLDAISAAKAMGSLSLGDALALCVVLAERDPVRYRRAASRWVARFADEASDVSLEEIQLVAAALAALPKAPKLALPLLRELVRVRQLVTVQSVFEDYVVIG